MYFSRGLIDGGEIHNNRGYGIHCYSKCQNTTIRNTRVHHNGSAGIFVAFNSGNVVHNVVADNNGGHGIWLAAPGAVADNNTTYNNGGLGICVDSTNIIVRNNIALGGLATNCNSGVFRSLQATILRVVARLCLSMRPTGISSLNPRARYKV